MTGRNDPCPCGSGRKYKKCCLPKDEAKTPLSSNTAESDEDSSAMGDPATPDDSLRRKIMTFSRSVDRGGTHFDRARREWEGDKKVEYSRTEGEGFSNFISLMDFFVHDYRFPGEGKYMLDLFCEAQCHNLPEAERILLEGWLDNHKALYEIEDVRAGVDARIRNLLTGQECKVYSKNTSHQLARWDVIYARLTKLGDGWEMTGTAQMIPRQRKADAIAYLKSEFEAFRRGIQGATLETYLKTSSPKIKRFFETLQKPYPMEYTTASGELITPVEAVFEVEDFLAVQGRLEAMKDFACVGESDEQPGGLRYDWLRRGPSLRAAFGEERKRPGTIRLLTSWIPSISKKGIPILGNLTLTDTSLVTSCLSQERMDALIALLEQRLGTLVRFKQSKRTPLEVLRAEKKLGGDKKQSEIPPDVKAKLVKKLLEDHYRRWKDMPLDVLGGLTPRQAAKDATRRGALIEVLKDVENIEARQRKSGQVVYGADRLRSELGV